MNKLAYEMGRQAAEEELVKLAAGAKDPGMWANMLDKVLASKITPYAAGSGAGAGLGAGAGYMGAPEDRQLEGALMGAGVGGLAGAGGTAALLKGLNKTIGRKGYTMPADMVPEMISANYQNLAGGLRGVEGFGSKADLLASAIKENPALYASLLTPAAAAGGAYAAGSQLDPGMLQQIKDTLGL